MQKKPERKLLLLLTGFNSFLISFKAFLSLLFSLYHTIISMLLHQFREECGLSASEVSGLTLSTPGTRSGWCGYQHEYPEASAPGYSIAFLTDFSHLHIIMITIFV